MNDSKKPSPCPRCSLARVHRSCSQQWKEKLLKVAGARKRRCHECGFDFFQWGSSIVVMKDVDRVGRRFGHILAALVSLALLLLAIHWFVLRLADPGASG